MTTPNKNLQVTCFVDNNKVDCKTWGEEYYDDIEYDDASLDGVEIDYTTQA